MAGPGDITIADTKRYERDVKEAYQRMGSKLRGTIRTVTGVIGADTTFQKVGKGTADTKARHGLVPVMNLDWSNVTCTLTDRYAGDWTDKLDALRTNVSEREVIVNAGAYALGRATDADIITALATASTSVTMTTTSSVTFRNSVISAIGTLRAADVPDDGNIFGAVSWTFWQWLLTVPQFASTDYVQGQPYANGSMVKNWLGVNWIPFTGVTSVGTASEVGYLYHKTALGHAIGAEQSSDITWHGDRAAWFINNMMRMGACLIDSTGVVKMPLDATVTLPTS